jgi:LysR family transcriptional regulator, glycine cleavage system transcriptional activator
VIRLPPLHALRVFEAVARLSNFTNAAHDLHLTQSAVSHQIRNLEEFFGTPLIIRDKRKLALTPEGTELYLATQEALNVVSDVTARIMARRNQVRIKALPSISVRLLMPRLGDFYRSHPGIEVGLTTVWENGPAYRLDQYDFAIQFCPTELTEVNVELLHEEWLTAVCAPSLLSGEHEATAELLAKYTLIHPTGNYDDWKVWLELAFGSGFNVEGPEQLVDTDYLAVEAALGGIGIAVLDPIYVREELASGRLIAPFKKRVKTGRGYFLISRSNPPLAQHHLKFRAWLYSVVNAAEREAGLE